MRLKRLLEKVDDRSSLGRGLGPGLGLFEMMNEVEEVSSESRRLISS